MSRARAHRALWATGTVAALSALAPGCTPPPRYEQPDDPRGYDILVTRTDTLAEAIADGLRQNGFTVRRRIRGGGRPTAFLLTFTFRESEPPRLTWLEARLADTRTGAVVAAASVVLDSLGPGAAGRARAVVDSLTVRLRAGH